MTTKHRHYLQTLGRPKRQRTITNYGVHRLDNTREEVMPPNHRQAAADDPWLSPQKSAIVRECLWRIEQAAAHTPISQSESQDFDLRGLCQDAKLTEPQTDILMLISEGWTQRHIASWLELSQASVCRHLQAGRHKLAGWLPLEISQVLTLALNQ